MANTISIPKTNSLTKEFKTNTEGINNIISDL